MSHEKLVTSHFRPASSPCNETPEAKCHGGCDVCHESPDFPQLIISDPKTNFPFCSSFQANDFSTARIDIVYIHVGFSDASCRCCPWDLDINVDDDLDYITILTTARLQIHLCEIDQTLVNCGSHLALNPQRRLFSNCKNVSTTSKIMGLQIAGRAVAMLGAGTQGRRLAYMVRVLMHYHPLSDQSLHISGPAKDEMYT